jgi:hypothetical protein
MPSRRLTALGVIIGLSGLLESYPAAYTLYHKGLGSLFEGVQIVETGLYPTIFLLVGLGSILSLLILSTRAGSIPLRSLPVFVVLSLLAIAIDFPAYYVVMHFGPGALLKDVTITMYSYRVAGLTLIYLVGLLYLYLLLGRKFEGPVLIKAPVITEAATKQGETHREPEVELMITKLWQSRTRNSRLIGFIFLIFSGLLFVVSYASQSLLFEIASLASFIIGAALLLSEVEPRVKLFPTSSSSLGSLLALAEVAEKELQSYAAYFTPVDGDTRMKLVSKADSGELVIPSIGEGLFQAYQRELGNLSRRGLDYFSSWIPKTAVQGLNLADSLKVYLDGGGVVKTVIEKPFIRALCVREDMRTRVCCTMGCPLVASIAQTIAQSAGKSVLHMGCSYDAATQTATSLHKLLDR